MKTISDILKLAAQHLQEKGVDRPRRDAEDLLAKVLSCQRLDLYLQFDRPLEEKELETLRNLVKRRARKEPIEYIFEEVHFFDSAISVSPHVLIPRPETEILVSKIAEKIDSTKPLVVWDVCCGSGAIGIALKKKFPRLNVFLSDLSKEALQVAQNNAKKNGVQVTFFHGDLLDPFENQKADIIICNPPYISEKEYGILDPSVRDYEPRMALVGGEDGLKFYRRLGEALPAYLSSGGTVYLEIGSTQGQAVDELFLHASWKKKTLEKDWAGKDRFFFLETE